LSVEAFQERLICEEEAATALIELWRLLN